MATPKRCVLLVIVMFEYPVNRNFIKNKGLQILLQWSIVQLDQRQPRKQTKTLPPDAELNLDSSLQTIRFQNESDFGRC